MLSWSDEPGLSDQTFPEAFDLAHVSGKQTTERESGGKIGK